jgi:LmbE family N-acetylglucosaminyl deacetylase
VRVLVVAPHPDDEILGCGGTLLRRVAEGAEVGCVFVTGMSEEAGWAPERIATRAAEIERVSRAVGFAQVFQLGLPPARLDTVAAGELVARLGGAFTAFAPEEVYLPNPGDIHTDHRAVFDAGAACCKWFRYPSVRRVLTYETLSETEFGLLPDAAFRPTTFVDISVHLERKLEILSMYESEVHPFPFPRSLEAMRALARLRGATAGFAGAEAFQLLRERA